MADGTLWMVERGAGLRADDREVSRVSPRLRRCERRSADVRGSFLPAPGPSGVEAPDLLGVRYVVVAPGRHWVGQSGDSEGLGQGRDHLRNTARLRGIPATVATEGTRRPPPPDECDDFNLAGARRGRVARKPAADEASRRRSRSVPRATMRSCFTSARRHARSWCSRTCSGRAGESPWTAKSAGSIESIISFAASPSNRERTWCGSGTTRSA